MKSRVVFILGCCCTGLMVNHVVARDIHTGTVAQVNAGHMGRFRGNVGQPGGGNGSVGIGASNQFAQPAVSVQSQPNQGFRSGLQPNFAPNAGGGSFNTQNVGTMPTANFGQQRSRFGSSLQTQTGTGVSAQSLQNGQPNFGGNTINVGTNHNLAPTFNPHTARHRNGTLSPNQGDFNAGQLNGAHQSVISPNSASNMLTTQTSGQDASFQRRFRSGLQPGSNQGTQVPFTAQAGVVNQSGNQFLHIQPSAVNGLAASNFTSTNFTNTASIGTAYQRRFHRQLPQNSAAGISNSAIDNMVMYDGRFMFSQGYFDKNFGVEPMYLGYGAGFGSLAFGSGYLGYNNPYFNGVDLGAAGFNYAQPFMANQNIPVSYQPPVAQQMPQQYPEQLQPQAPPQQPPNYSLPPARSVPATISLPATDSAAATSSASRLPDALLSGAIVAFKQNQFDQALDLLNKAVELSPKNVVIHEFRSLALFAKGDFQQSTAAIHAVLAVSPTWDWNTLISLYSDIGVYTSQLRALESFAKQNPDDGASRFLLAYHYLTADHQEAAVRMLRRVTVLVPNDHVAADLLKALQPSEAAPPREPITAPAELPPPMEPVAIATPIDQTKLVGDWTASRPDGSSFLLKLAKDGTFEWKYTPNEQSPQSFDGTYTLASNVIILKRKSGDSLVAELRNRDESRFQFKLIGAPAEDPGLQFLRNTPDAEQPTETK